MAELPRPLNALELADGESKTFTVLRWEVGEEVITPPHAPQGKRITVLRVHVRPDDVVHFPPYYDLTSARLVANLKPQLEHVGLLSARWTITAHGFPPKKYFTVERVTSS